MNQEHLSTGHRATADLDDLMAEVRASLAPSPPSRERLSVTEIMRRVQDELSRRRAGTPTGDDPGTSDTACGDETATRFQPWRSALRADAGKKEFVLGELLAASDVTFVELAYRALLRRDPDPAGYDHYVSSLRSGRMSKVELLGALRWSPEGRARSVHVDGLLVPCILQRWKKIPVLGPIIAWLHGVLRLGSLAERQSQADAAMAREMHGLGDSLNELARRLEERIEGAESRHSQQWHVLQEELAPLPVALREHDQRLVRIASALDEGIARRIAVERTLEEFGRSLERQIGEVRQAIGEDRLAARKGMAALDASVEKLSAAQRGVVEQLAAMKARVGELAPVLAAVEAAQRNIDKLSSASAGISDRLASMQSHLDALNSFSAVAIAAQQALEKLGERQAEMESALKALPVIERRMRENRELLQGGIDQVRAVLEAGSGQQSRHEARLSVHEQQLAEHTGTLERYGAVLSVMEQLESKERAFERSLDPLYAAFEGRFRGDPSLVRTRVEPYVRLVVDAGAGSESAPVLDLGCGRGEWLALLRENGLVGRGIDSNQVFIEMCRGQGLDVIEGDIIEVMRNLPDGSMGAITGMHIVEHLPFEVLMRLLDEARRLLVPGGLIVLETPNPENLQVATEFFYLDPTHRNPLPPEALRWMVEARGFDHARIERLTLARETGAPPLLDDTIPGADSMNVLLSRLAAAPDYSIIARRAGA